MTQISSKIISGIFLLFIFSFSFLGSVYAQGSSIDGTSGESKTTSGANTKTEVRMDGLVPVCHKIVDGKDTDIPCESFEQLITAVKSIIDFAVKFVLMFTVVIIAYAGWLYMSSGSNPAQRSDANKMFVSVGKGIFFILAAWLIVTLITNALLKQEFIDSSILK